MKYAMKPIKDQVIVITGASSGIGLRTAQLAAERGAKVLLVARDEDALRTACNEIKAKGGQAEYVAADVGDRMAIENAANEAITRFGPISTWMNIAGVGVWGMEQDIPIEEARQLFETNFWGVVYGTRAALRLMGNRPGCIINMGSVESERALPLHSFYAASKHAIKGYTDAVRMECEKQELPIAITLIKPASIDTPFADHSRNYMSDSSPRYMPPVYSTDIVAEAIMDCLVNPRREVTISGSGKMIEFLESTAPKLLDKVMELTAFRSQKRDSRPTGHSHNLYEPGEEQKVHGTHNGRVKGTSLSTAISLHPARMLATGLAIGGAGYALWKAWSTEEAPPRSWSEKRAQASQAVHDVLEEVGTYKPTPSDLGASPEPLSPS